jgi:hypothetical protein
MANFSDPAYREGYNHGSLSSSGSIVDLFTGHLEKPAMLADYGTQHIDNH